MTVLEAYIHLQQRLQNIAAFVNREIDEREMDYIWSGSTDRLLRLIVPSDSDKDENDKYSNIQASLDDIRVLEVLGQSGTLTSFTQGTYTGKKVDLPANYRHLLNDRTLVHPLTCATGVNYEVPNRLTKSDPLFNILDSKLYCTTAESPVSRLSGNTLHVYNTYRGIKQFDIENIYFDYLKKPAAVAYGANGSSTIEFPDNVCFKILDIAAIYAAIIAEQNPNKIQFLANVTNS